VDARYVADVRSVVDEHFKHLANSAFYGNKWGLKGVLERFYIILRNFWKNWINLEKNLEKN
jgi:hypothetical protein